MALTWIFNLNPKYLDDKEKYFIYITADVHLGIFHFQYIIYDFFIKMWITVDYVRE